MPAPHPDDFKALIPQTSGSVCTAFKNALLRLPVLVYQLVKYMFNPDGTITDEFRGNLGVVPGGTGTGGSGALLAPTGVLATDGTYLAKIVVTWNAVAGASYILYRSEVDDPATAIQIATAPSPTYEDSNIVVGVNYNYWVKSTNGTQTSGFSASDSGYATAAAGSGTFTRGSNTDGSSGGYVNWVVPTGVMAINVKLWGAGAGGGGASDSAWSPAGASSYSGGGGGGGEHRLCSSGGVNAITVTPAETLRIYVGKRGIKGTVGNGGSSGRLSKVMRGGTVLVSAGGGKSGSEGGPNFAGGSGGGGGTGGTGCTGTPGVNGGNGVIAAPGVTAAGGAGGGPGVAASGNAVGGNGGSTGHNGEDGTDGRIEITW